MTSPERPSVFSCDDALPTCAPSDSLNHPEEGGYLRPTPDGWVCRFGARYGCACLYLDVRRRRYPAGRCLCHGWISHKESARRERYRIWPARCVCRRFRIAAAEQASGGTCAEIGNIIQVATAHRTGITVDVHVQSRFPGLIAFDRSASPAASLRVGHDPLPCLRPVEALRSPSRSACLRSWLGARGSSLASDRSATADCCSLSSAISSTRLRTVIISPSAGTDSWPASSAAGCYRPRNSSNQPQRRLGDGPGRLPRGVQAGCTDLFWECRRRLNGQAVPTL